MVIHGMSLAQADALPVAVRIHVHRMLDSVLGIIAGWLLFFPMPRIQFQRPQHFFFSTEIQIYISHVNQGGHLDNAQLLTLVSEARVRFFKKLG